MNKIDWDIINLEKIFGIVWGVDDLKRNQTLFIRTEIVEKAIDVWSSGQLKYVGDTKNGMDFEGCDGLRYECKMTDDLFLKKKDLTKKIIAKNHRSKKKEIEHSQPTWDKMILICATTNTIALADYGDAEWKNNDGDSELRFKKSDCKILAENVTADPIKAAMNIGEKINKLIDDCIR